ncbi:LON peptidase substrate-binding domain-containing protein [Candidatus Pelagibacter sp.]|jgi:Lon protease-like protein|nr:LON peptidase substrate-binding domain-containing protein [Candidatus Pelagibacter sp.]
MIKIKDLPTTIPIFPLSNFIIFPNTTVPLNVFEPRYVDMINESMKKNKMIGLIQPKKSSINSIPDLHEVGCLGKITNFQDIDGRYLIDLSGLSRFNITKEIKNNKPYRECLINFDGFQEDLRLPINELKFNDLDLIFKNLKSLFQKKGYIINWKSLEKQDLNETINALAMASPFSLEEKQALLESASLEVRKDKIAEILSTYNHDNYYNTTIQ